MAKPANIRIDLSGEREIVAALRRAEDAVGEHLQPATEAGAEILRKEVADRAPRGETGELAENIMVETEVKGDQVVVSIGPDRDRFYGLFLEFGAAAHEITPDTAGALSIAGYLPRARADHKGVAAQPFMRPAFDGKKDAAEAEIVGDLKKGLGLD